MDYINDGDLDESRRWTNWSATPSANPDVSVGVIFKENGKIVERTVNQAKLHFFADSGTDAPSKLVLERYVGPDFDVPTYYSNYRAYESNHSFNNPDNWESVPYNMNQDIQAGTELTATFNAVKSKAMRWRMDRKEDKNGVALIEMTFLAPSELPKESTKSKILLNGKELPDFSAERLEYQVSYSGQRPKVTVEENDQVASTVVDSGDNRLPVLVRLLSESGKQVKEYRIQLTEEKATAGKVVAAVQEELPRLEVEEKELPYQTIEKEDANLYLGETRVEEEGQNGKERIFTEVAPDGQRAEKLREVVQDPINRVLLVGTKKGTALPEDDIKDLVLYRPELLIEEEEVDFQVQERKNHMLPVGQTRIIQEGRKGIRVNLVELENGKRTLKESYNKLETQDQILEVGTALSEEKTKSQDTYKAYSQTSGQGKDQSLEEKVQGTKAVKEDHKKAKSEAVQLQAEKVKSTEKGYLPNTGSQSDQATITTGLALLGLGAGLAARKRRKED